MKGDRNTTADCARPENIHTLWKVTESSERVDGEESSRR